LPIEIVTGADLAGRKRLVYLALIGLALIGAGGLSTGGSGIGLGGSSIGLGS
jgi:hypothetical protein